MGEREGAVTDLERPRVSPGVSALDSPRCNVCGAESWAKVEFPTSSSVWTLVVCPACLEALSKDAARSLRAAKDARKAMLQNGGGAVNRAEIRLVYLPVNAAWAFCLGSPADIGSWNVLCLEDASGPFDQFFQSRADAVRTAERLGLQVDRSGRVR